MLGTPVSLKSFHVWVLSAALTLSGCAGDDEGGTAGNAGSGTTGGTGGDGDGDGDAGRCEDRGCWVSLAAFQAEALHCESTYALAQSEYAQGAGEECLSAFFECDGLQGAAYQYGFTGDNVQCYYDDDGALVGGVRTSDHGPNTVAGEIPDVSCYGGPDCGDAGSIDIPDLRTCQVNSDCVLVYTASCCPCGQPEPMDVVAVNVERSEQFQNAQCPPPISCTDVFCPPQPPRVIPSCVAGTCEVIDLNEQAALECEAPADCSVRSAACCECGAPTSPGSLIAVSDQTAFASLACDPSQVCAACEPSYPREVTATCSASGSCELNDTRE
jgi:hypothetical protein